MLPTLSRSARTAPSGVWAYHSFPSGLDCILRTYLKRNPEQAEKLPKTALGFKRKRANAKTALQKNRKQPGNSEAPSIGLKPISRQTNGRVLRWFGFRSTAYRRDPDGPDNLQFSSQSGSRLPDKTEGITLPSAARPIRSAEPSRRRKGPR